MMRSALSLLGLLAGLSAAWAQPLSSLPDQLKGVWDIEGGDACAAKAGRLLPWSFRFNERQVLVARDGQIDQCVYKGIRQITPTRWYFDLDSTTGLVSLDVNQLTSDRILVAMRPLGEASFLVRCGEEG